MNTTNNVGISVWQIALSWAKWCWRSCHKDMRLPCWKGQSDSEVIFTLLRKIAKKLLLLSLLLFVRQSVRPSAWNNSVPSGRTFMIFDIWGFFRKSVEKIHLSDMNNRYFTWRLMYVNDYASLTSSQYRICFRQKLWRKSGEKFFVQHIFPENNVMWKNMVQPGRPQMTI